MGITTVAEFVETDDLRIRMTNLGVDYGQGFAIGKPQPLEEVLQELSLYELVASGGMHDEEVLIVGDEERPLRSA
jgi:predicted signal transduction protein with EAL and GGDEF domain